MRVANLKISLEETDAEQDAKVQTESEEAKILNALEEAIAALDHYNSKILNIEHKIKTSNLAENEYRIRRLIDQIFDFSGFVQSPAWDIMLDLFAAESSGRAISVTSACIGAACPGTTGLRWLAVLQEKGLLVRSEDPADRRRTIVTLSNEGMRKTRQAIEVRHFSMVR